MRDIMPYIYLAGFIMFVYVIFGSSLFIFPGEMLSLAYPVLALGSFGMVKAFTAKAESTTPGLLGMDDLGYRLAATAFKIITAAFIIGSVIIWLVNGLII